MGWSGSPTYMAIGQGQSGLGHPPPSPVKGITDTRGQQNVNYFTVRKYCISVLGCLSDFT